MAVPTFTFAVDWDGAIDVVTGDEDITDDVLAYRVRRGRQKASQLERAIPMEGYLVVRNTNGKYSSFNSSGDLFGMLLPGRQVRIATTAPVTALRAIGFIESITLSHTFEPTAVIRFTGPFGALERKKLTLAKMTDALTGDIIDEILTQVGWWEGDSTLDAGQTTVPNWYINDANKYALDAIREIEDTEFGFVYEGAEGEIIFEDRHHRLKGAHLTSQATYSDAASPTNNYLIGIEQVDPLENIYNEIRIDLKPLLTATASEELWSYVTSDPTFGPHVRVEASQDLIIYATAPEDVAFVETWSDPVVGIDIITNPAWQASAISVSATEKFSNQMKITITETGGIGVQIDEIHAFGVPVRFGNTLPVIAADPASEYPPRTFTFAGTSWAGGFEQTKQLADFLLESYSVPRPAFMMPVAPSFDTTMLTQFLNRAISDRVTVVATGLHTKMGVNQDFFIEGIEEGIDFQTGIFEMSLVLSPVLSLDDYWILGTSELGTDSRLAY